jgi:ABC-type transporter MlaC component
MDAGSAALGNPNRLSTLYERYFEGERIAQLAAGRDWKRYSEIQRNAQRNRVKRFVVGVLAPSFSEYKGSEVEFLSESDSKVKGAVTDSQGQRRTVTWYFTGECKFVNLSIDGYGSLISFVGKEPARN